MTDVVVVGGGPAGSVTAMLLARQGYQVTLLERQRFPRAKPCGDCLSPAANRVLLRLGVWNDILSERPGMLQGWQLTSPGNASFSAKFRDVDTDPLVHRSVALSRHKLDAILLKHAQDAGVTVHQDAHVTELTYARSGAVSGVTARVDGRTVSLNARLTIGADGLRSIVARRLRAHARRPRLRKASFTMHVPLPTRLHGEMYLASGACLGIAPVEDGSGVRLHNVTLVLTRGTYDGAQGVHAIVSSGLEKFGMLGLQPTGEILTSGPFDWPARRTVFDGAVLVGDAAGYYDPFTGQGIFHALSTAELLAEYAGHALRKPDVRPRDLKAFAHAQKRMSRNANRVQRIIEFVCARPQMADRVFQKFAHDPVIARALIGVTADLSPATSLLSPALWARLAQ